jgi:hypothetical protein
MESIPQMSLEKYSKVSLKYDQIFKRSCLDTLTEKLMVQKKQSRDENEFVEKLKQQRLKKLEYL